MDDLWTVRRFAKWFFELPDDAEPTKSHINSINARSREGKLPAIKVCNMWRIDVSEIMKEARHAKKKSGAR